MPIVKVKLLKIQPGESMENFEIRLNDTLKELGSWSWKIRDIKYTLNNAGLFIVSIEYNEYV